MLVNTRIYIIDSQDTQVQDTQTHILEHTIHN